MPAKRSISTAIWIFLVALVVRLFVLANLTRSPYFLPLSGDMKFYCDWARQIAAGHFTDHRAFYGLPGYPFLVAGLFSLFGANLFIVEALQAAADAMTAALVFEIARFIVPGTNGRIAGVLAAAGWIFYEPAQAFSVVLMPVSWLLLAFWAIVWWSMRTSSRSAWRPWLCVGVIAGLVATMVATILFVLPVPAVAAVRNLRKPIAILAAFASLIVGVLIGTSPCWMHNYLAAREPVFLSAHSGINFWVGNNPIANGYPTMPSGLRASQQEMLRDSIRLAEAEAGRPLNRAEVSRFWSAKASAYIRQHPGQWLALMATKLRNFWNAFQYDDLSLIALLSEDGILLPGLRFGIVAALAIPGLLFAARYSGSRWVAGAVLLHMAALLPVFITERYRLAAAPGLLILASVGLVLLWDCMAKRNPGWWRFAALYCAIGLASSWLVSLPQKDETLWSLDDYNSGLKALNAGQLDRAQAKLDRALAYSPHKDEINRVLGDLWLRKNDQKKAEQYYVRAISFSPRDDRGELQGSVGALNNLAILEMERKNWDFAQHLLAAALRMEPGDANMRFVLAYAECNKGDREAARTEISKALALKPNQPQFQKLQQEIETGQPLSPLPLKP